MTTLHRQILYGLLSLLGALLTWSNNLRWIAEAPETSVQAFWQTAFATPVSASLGWDIVIAAIACLVLVAHETRRLGMWRWWPVAYFVLANVVAAACAIPLFLLFRERVLARG